MTKPHTNASSTLAIGWAQQDITPDQVVFIGGQMHARLSEGVRDPLTVTAWALESGDEQAVWVSCDLISIEDRLRNSARELLRGVQHETGFDPRNLVINATHTHTAPLCRLRSRQSDFEIGGLSGADLEAMQVTDYVAFAAKRIADAVVTAWSSRQSGSIAYGLGYAVIGRNRRWVNVEGKTTMYRLTPNVYDTFRHIEGYEDHRVQLLATYGPTGQLSGLVVNVPCPSQEDGMAFYLSADYWHEVRLELRRRFGEHLFILPQCSAAGDLVPQPLMEREANARMQRLLGTTAREEIARRLADTIGAILPAIGAERIEAPVMRHQVIEMELPLHALSEEDVATAEAEVETYRTLWETERDKLREHPEMRELPRWYVPLTGAYGRMHWQRQVSLRYEQQQQGIRTRAVEVHVMRLGEIVFASNPFELYVDFGLQLDLRSPALQTFLVQLAGGGTYVPSPRSVLGGGYGSVPASNVFGPSAGQILVDETVKAIHAVWQSEEQGESSC